MASKDLMRVPNKDVFYVMLRTHINTTRYSQCYFTVWAEKPYKREPYCISCSWVQFFQREKQHVTAFRGCVTFSGFFFYLIDPSFIHPGTSELYWQILSYWSPFKKKKKKKMVSENVMLCKVQKKLPSGMYRGKNFRGKRPSQPTSVSVVSVPLTLSASVRHFCGHSLVLLAYFKVEAIHSSSSLLSKCQSRLLTCWSKTHQ